MSEIDKLIKAYSGGTMPSSQPVTRSDLVYLATCFKKDLDALGALFNSAKDIRLERTKEFPLTPIQPVTTGDPIDPPYKITSQGKRS